MRKAKVYSGTCLFYFRIEEDSDEEVYEKIEKALGEDAYHIRYIDIDEVEEEDHYEDNYGN